MPTTPLFPLPEGLEMTSLSDTPDELLVRVISYRSSSPCPHCSTPSSAIHSSYRRHPKDLPCAGRPIRLVFTVRKFFCRNPTCSCKVFTERLPDFLEASSRLTKRLRTAVQEIGFATGGKGGERLGDKLAMPISEATVLCSLFLVPLPEVSKVHVVGVDDWSWRRGKRFGSILVNLETHKIIGLLADREAESVRQWLATHPEVDVVSRDRGKVYIDGATLGAPQATQVADRWHILSNLGDAVEEFLISGSHSTARAGSSAAEGASARQASLIFFGDSCQPTQVAGTSPTQMEPVSAGAALACVWDELAQDWGRTWCSSQYRPKVLPAASRATPAYSATTTCQSA